MSVPVTKQMIAVAKDIEAEARAKGIAFLQDVRLAVVLNDQGDIEVQDLFTDEVLKGSLVSHLSARL